MRNNSVWFGDWRLMNHWLVRWLMHYCGFMRMLDELMHDLCGIAVGVAMMVIHQLDVCTLCTCGLCLVAVTAVAITSATAATAARLIAIRFCSNFFTRSDQQIRLHGHF